MRIDVFKLVFPYVLALSVVLFAPWRLWMEKLHKEGSSPEPRPIWWYFAGVVTMAIGLTCFPVALERSDLLDYDAGHAEAWGMAGVVTCTLSYLVMKWSNEPIDPE